MTTNDADIPSHFEVRRAERVGSTGHTFYDVVDVRTGTRHVHIRGTFPEDLFCALYPTPSNDPKGAKWVAQRCLAEALGDTSPPSVEDTWPRSADHAVLCAAAENGELSTSAELVAARTLVPTIDTDAFLRHRGHFAFADPNDPSSPLRFVGTVYEDAASAFGSPTRHAFAALSRALFPGHVYADGSGIDPTAVAGLTYEEVVAFAHRFYHPAAATFISRGDVTLREVLEVVRGAAATDAEPRRVELTPEVEASAEQVVAGAPLPSGDGDRSRGHVVIGWVGVAPSADHYERLLLDVAVSTLFGEGGAVRREVERSGLVGGAMHASVTPYRRPMIAISCEDTDPGSAEPLFATVMRTLYDVVRQGLPEDAVDAVLADIERRRRSGETGAFLEAVIPPLLYGGDPFAPIELDTDLDGLRAARREGRPFEDTIRRELIDNPHRALVVLSPDPALAHEAAEAERRLLADRAATMSEAEREKIAETARRLLRT